MKPVSHPNNNEVKNIIPKGQMPPQKVTCHHFFHAIFHVRIPPNKEHTQEPTENSRTLKFGNI